MQPDCVGFVLAGGLSSRMGTDKALVPLGGEPLIAHALCILHEANLEPHIAGARSPLAHFAPVVEDAGQGPLGGICAALASTQARWAVFLPVDQPLLPPSLLRELLWHAQVTGAVATVPRVSGFTETFPAVVDRAALSSLEAALAAGAGGCFRALQTAAQQLGRLFSAVPLELLIQAGQLEHQSALPPTLWFVNLNAPMQIARAEALLARRDPADRDRVS
jgi:molybdenum cofactor guanylyltransferase